MRTEPCYPIVRGTTPAIIFKFKHITVSDITSCLLDVHQKTTINSDEYKVIAQRDLSQAAETGDNYIKWFLTQEETLSLDEDIPLKIQIKYKLNSGKVAASPVYTPLPYEILNEEVI